MEVYQTLKITFCRNIHTWNFILKKTLLCNVGYPVETRSLMFEVSHERMFQVVCKSDPLALQ